MIDASIRRDFPLLVNQPELIYFDNACMSLRPRQVIEAISNYYTTMSACAGRSNHQLGVKVTEAVDEARRKLQKFISAKKETEIVFTRNTTEGLNLVARSVDLKKGDVVVISDKEHNSNLVPWLMLKEKIGIEVNVVPSSDNNLANLEQWQKAINQPGVKLVSLVYTSNLDGVTNPVKEIVKLAHMGGAMIMVDAAQTAPHQKINVQDLDVDFMAFSAHKMCGPTGMGALYGKSNLLEQLTPFMVGGDTVATTSYEGFTMLPVPEKFEAGLQDYAGIIGFGAAIDYLSEVGIDNIHKHELYLNEVLTKGMESFERVKIIGPAEAKLRGGISAFIIEGADHHQVALMLDQMGKIAVRSGQHCVHSWFNSRNVSGSLRVSLYFYNTMEEVEQFLEVLAKILRIV